MPRNFAVLIEQGEDNSYIATVPALKSCYTQADTIPEVLEKIREVIELCIEAGFPIDEKFVEVRQIEVAV
ncbi:MAG: type II toxin-antitoxin system HicB family antitoxin [Defluviitaleaceae bacterium]|nr:type II toxin-antitoxin system HicB family antitoxin [Defluviitaleaceae bacterium]